MGNKPNILIIMTDQLTWKALPAYGNSYCKTPNIDRIMRRGVRFDNCYTPCPLCQPARAAFWAGLFPHQTGILSNGKKFPVPVLDDNISTLGSLFSQAGYNTMHFGKTHDAGSLRGFYIEPVESMHVEGTDAWPVTEDTYRDRYTTSKVVEYLQKIETNDKPYILIADLINPHNICKWIGFNAGVHEDVTIEGDLPALPDNFEMKDIEKRPKPIQYICCSHNRQSQAAEWNSVNYKHYLAAYYHYIEVVDAEIGLILDALESRPDADNTLVVFMADHGDGMAAHGLVTKQVNLYEETTRVPFAFCGPGIASSGVKLSEPLVSLLDLVPTLCDYAGIEISDGLWGCTLMPWLKEEKGGTPHLYIASEWHTEWGYTISPGRMIRTQRYKYTRYLEGNGEELYDLKKDPGENYNLKDNPEYIDILEEHRKLLQNHLRQTNDPFYQMTWMADSKWRSHKLGFNNHVGPAAPMV